MAYAGYLYDGSGNAVLGPSPRAVLGSFRNTQRSRLRAMPTPPVASSSGHRDSRSLDLAIRDCRALCRDSEIASAIQSSASDCIVGDHVGLLADGPYDAWNAEVEQRFARWAERCEVTGQLSLADVLGSCVSEALEAGSLLINKIAAGEARPGMLQLVEADRLGNPRGLGDDDRLRAGVETDAMGRVLAYHVRTWDRHQTSFKPETTRVPAGDAWLINDPFVVRPGAYRTEPRLLRVVDRIENLEIARDSSLAAYELSTLIALFISREDPTGTINSQLAQAIAGATAEAGGSETEAEVKRRGPWQPGLVMEGGVNEKATTIQPSHPTTAFDQMLWTELQVIAAGLGMPPEVVWFRFIRNYSASRAALAVYWRSVLRYRQRLEAAFLRPMYRWWLLGEIRAGRIDDPDPTGADESMSFTRCRFIWPPMPQLDPKAEAEAAAFELSAGLSTHAQALLRLHGEDRRDFIKAREKELEWEREHGFTVGARPVARTESVDRTEEERDQPSAISHQG